MREDKRETGIAPPRKIEERDWPDEPVTPYRPVEIPAEEPSESPHSTPPEPDSETGGD